MHDALRKGVIILFIVICIFTAGVIFRLASLPSPPLLPYPDPPISAPYPNPLTPTPYTPGPVNHSHWPSPTIHPLLPDLSTTPMPRHGMAAAFADGPIRPDMGEWTYVWSPFPNREELADDTIPMLHSSVYEGGLISRRLVENRSVADLRPYPYWSVLNECDNNWQCDAAPEEAADFYYQEVMRMMNTLDPADVPAQALIIGGTSAHACGIEWLARFVQTYEERYGPIPRAGWHFHIYPGLVADPEKSNCNAWYFDYDLVKDPASINVEFERQLDNILNFLWTEVWAEGEEITDEIWITEMGCILGSYNDLDGTVQPGLTPMPGATFVPGCDATHDGGYPLTYHFVAEITGRLQDEWRWVDRYAWYTNWEPAQRYPYAQFYEMTPVPEGLRQPIPDTIPTLTNLGTYFEQITPAPAIAKPTPVAVLHLPIINNNSPP